LVSAEDFKAARASVDIAAKQKRQDQKQQQKDLEKKRSEARAESRDAKRKKQASTLSFTMDDEDNEEDEEVFTIQKKKIRKDPTVDTSFLPDAERDQAETAVRNKLKKEWLEKQEELKKEPLEVVYSYWDGSGHRKVIQVTKGTTIGKFLSM
jgi:protein FAM50